MSFAARETVDALIENKGFAVVRYPAGLYPDDSLWVRYFGCVSYRGTCVCCGSSLTRCVVVVGLERLTWGHQCYAAAHPGTLRHAPTAARGRAATAAQDRADNEVGSPYPRVAAQALARLAETGVYPSPASAILAPKRCRIVASNAAALRAAGRADLANALLGVWGISEDYMADRATWLASFVCTSDGTERESRSGIATLETSSGPFSASWSVADPIWRFGHRAVPPDLESAIVSSL
jgi:hypothetical protein